MTIAEKAAIAAAEAIESLLLNNVSLTEPQSAVIEEAIAQLIEHHLMPTEEQIVNAAEMYG